MTRNEHHKALMAIGAYCLIGIFVLLVFWGLGDIFIGVLR